MIVDKVATRGRDVLVLEINLGGPPEEIDATEAAVSRLLRAWHTEAPVRISVEAIEGPPQSREDLGLDIDIDLALIQEETTLDNGEPPTRATGDGRDDWVPPAEL